MAGVHHIRGRPLATDDRVVFRVGFVVTTRREPLADAVAFGEEVLLVWEQCDAGLLLRRVQRQAVVPVGTSPQSVLLKR